jgi:hypothetical protein
MRKRNNRHSCLVCQCQKQKGTFKNIVNQSNFYFLCLIRFLRVLKGHGVTTYRNAVGNESCHHIAHISEELIVES